MIVRKKKKYYHGGVHPTGEEADVVYRASAPTAGATAVVTNPYVNPVRQFLDETDIPYAIGPYGAARGQVNLGDALDVITDFTPLVGDVKEAARIQQDIQDENYLDAAIGAGLFLVPGAVASKAGPYIKRGAERVMNFLRPKADETADVAKALVDQAQRKRMLDALNDDYEKQVMEFMTYEEDELLEILAEGEAGIGMFGDEEMDYAREALRRLRGGNRTTPDAYLIAGMMGDEFDGKYVQGVWDDRSVFGFDELDRLHGVNKVDLGPTRSNYGSIRPNISREQLKAMGPEQLQEGLETSNRLLKERMDEFFSDEGQRRARQQIEDQVTYYDRLSRAPDETLERLGFDKAQRVVLRRAMQKYRRADGAIDLNSAAIAKDLADFNTRMRGVANRSGEVVQRANMAGKSDEAIVNLRRLRDEAYDAGDYQRVADLEDQILQTQQAALTRDQLIERELTNAFYEHAGDNRSIMLGRENLADPDYATSATIHELQHAFQDVPSRVPYVGEKLGRTVEADRILDDLVLIDPRNPNITTDQRDHLWSDLGYFQQRKQGRLTEKTPFLSEMREDMLSKGYISHRHQEVTDNLMDRYLKDYYGARNVSTPSTDAGNKNVRILEIMDPNTGAYNRGVLKDALNKMLVAVPAVGAAGIAAGTTADSGSSYYKGGKLKLKKEKRYGMRVV
mgnify:FL=1